MQSTTSKTIQTLRAMVQQWKDQRTQKAAMLGAAEVMAATEKPGTASNLPTPEQIEIAAAMDGIKGTSNAQDMRSTIQAHADALKAWHTASNEAAGMVQALKREIEALDRVIAEGELQELAELSEAGSGMLEASKAAHAGAVVAMIQATAELSAVMGLIDAKRRAERNLRVSGQTVEPTPSVIQPITVPGMGNDLLRGDLIHRNQLDMAIVDGASVNQLAGDALGRLLGQLRGEV